MGKHASVAQGQIGQFSARGDDPGTHVLHATREVTGVATQWSGSHWPQSPTLEGLPDRGVLHHLTLDRARRVFERDYLIRVLELTAGNVTRAARIAGRNRTEFYRLLDRHALRPASFKMGRESVTGTS